MAIAVCTLWLMASRSFAPPGLRHNDGGTHRKPDKEIDNQVDQRRGGTHRGHGVRTFELPHDHKIGRVEEQLQKTSGNDRKRI